MRYIWVEVHLNCRPVPHTSLEIHTKQRMAYVQVVVHVFLLKGHFFLGFHCPARCFIDKYRIYKIIDVDYWYCWGVTIPNNVH